MRIDIDHEANATYVRLKQTPDGKVVTKDYAEYYLDYDEAGDLVGIEYLHLPVVKHHSRWAYWVRKLTRFFT